MELNLSIEKKDIESIIRQEVRSKIQETASEAKIFETLGQQLTQYIATYVHWEKGVRNATKEVVREIVEEQYRRHISEIVEELYKKHMDEIVVYTSKYFANMMFDKITESNEYND